MITGTKFHNQLIPNYSVVRLDRHRHGGGVAIYVHNCFAFKVLLYGPSGLELLVLSLSPVNNPNFTMCTGVFYRPPSSTHDIFDTLCNSLFCIPPAYFSNFVLLGDFNVNLLNSDHPLYDKIDMLCNSFSFTQVVDSPTHISHSAHPSLIDLVFVSDTSCFSHCHTIPQLANSDHYGITIYMSGKGKANHSKSVRRKVWQYKHTDFHKANDLLMDIQPNDVLDYSDIERSWHNWKQVFLGIMEECIPCSTLPNRKNLPWLTKHIIQLIRKRNNLFKRAQRSGDPRDYQSYKEIRNKVVSELRTSKQNFFASLNPQCPRDFWKMIKQLNPNTTTFPALAFENVTAYTDRDKANILNHAFSSYFNEKQPPLSTSDLLQLDPNECPVSILCTEEETYELLSNTDTTKANGHDDISALMLKRTALSIAPIVTELFNISISHGVLPQDWKTARVSPIPKSGDNTNPSNYRPVSLLSILSKLLERHFVNLLLDYIQAHSPLSPLQWGFTSGKSATSALLHAVDAWHKFLVEGTDI